MSARVQPSTPAARHGWLPQGVAHPMAWALVWCAACALLGATVIGLAPGLPALLGATPRQMGIWLTMALLLGLWMIPSLPRLFPVLLALLVMRLFDLAPTSLLLSGALNDAALWWLGAFALSVAARQCGLLGVLLAHALRSLQTPHTSGGLRVPAVLWLSMAFALLPSPLQASRWARSFCLAPGNASSQLSRDTLGAAQLLARLGWLPAHPANLLVLALLPSGGVDRFVPAHWVLHTWPLLVLALGYAIHAQWRARPAQDLAEFLPQTQSVLPEDRFAMQSARAIAVGLVLMVALQPFHGFAPGLVSLLAMVALFALKVLTPKSFHRGVDWSLFVAAPVLPGLIASFAAALPAWSLEGSGTSLALPLLFLLRMVAPTGVATVAALVLTMSWASGHGHDLLDTAMPVLVALHAIDFVLHRHPSVQAATRFHLAWDALRSPVTWGACAAYYLWLGWWGW